jgi:hypothetical protein
MMTNESTPNDTDSSALDDILKQLTITQLRFIVARNESKSDREAAEMIGISPSTVKGWDNKAQVDEAIRLMLFDGIVMARTLRRRNLAKAMAVKVAGLNSVDEKLRQSVATEIVEWEMGKAQGSVDVTSKGEQIQYVNVGVDLDKL